MTVRWSHENPKLAEVRAAAAIGQKITKRPVASCAAEVSQATHTSHWLEMPLNGRFELRRMSAHGPQGTFPGAATDQVRLSALIRIFFDTAFCRNYA